MKTLFANTTATRALIWTEAMIVMTTIHHVYRMGAELLIAGTVLAVIPVLLLWWHSRRSSAIARWAFAVNTALVFVYFGIIDGLLDHVFKAVGLQNSTFLPGSDAEIVATVYKLWSVEAGHIFYEYTGVLTFVIGLVAVYFSYRFVRMPLTREGDLAPLARTAS